MTAWARRLTDDDQFEGLTIFVIVLNALCMGAETVPELSGQYEGLLSTVFTLSQIFFVVEIALRLVSYAPAVKDFFRESWNIFDFLIVVASFLPVVGVFALTARLLRLMRVLRIISVSDSLRGFVSRFSSLAAPLFAAGVVWVILSYIFALAGFYLFSDLDPEHWGSLGDSFSSVFYLWLLQDVRAFVDPIREIQPFALTFFILFFIAWCSLVLHLVSEATISKGTERGPDEY